FWDSLSNFPDEGLDCMTSSLYDKLTLYSTHFWNKSDFNQAQEEEKHHEWLTLREDFRNNTLKFKGQGIYINPSKSDLQKVNRRVLYIEQNQNLEDFTSESRIQDVAHRAQKQVNHLLQNNPWQSKGRSR
uniref:hypothetical protein n=1 Tax=Lactococcus petauri TaxID=1940789 RepID=UPI001F5A4DFE